MLFIKPGITGDLPADLLNYQRGQPSFPQQTTLDQFFDEAQWESYRKLGETIAAELFREPPWTNPEQRRVRFGSALAGRLDPFHHDSVFAGLIAHAPRAVPPPKPHSRLAADGAGTRTCARPASSSWMAALGRVSPEKPVEPPKGAKGARTGGVASLHDFGGWARITIHPECLL